MEWAVCTFASCDGRIHCGSAEHNNYYIDFDTHFFFYYKFDNPTSKCSLTRYICFDYCDGSNSSTWGLSVPNHTHAASGIATGLMMPHPADFREWDEFDPVKGQHSRYFCRHFFEEKVSEFCCNRG